MQKIIRVKKVKEIIINLASNQTAVTVFVTVAVMATVQVTILLAIMGEWARVGDKLVLLILIGAIVMAHRTINTGGKLINLQQDLITNLSQWNEKHEATIKEQKTTINKLSGHLAQAKGELNKINGNTKKEQSTDESAAANTGA